MRERSPVWTALSEFPGRCRSPLADKMRCNEFELNTIAPRAQISDLTT